MMQHIDAVLAAALTEIERQAPHKLASTINHAVFPGGARIRPRLCHAVAQAAGSDCPPLLSAVAPPLRALVREMAERLVPASLRQTTA